MGHESPIHSGFGLHFQVHAEYRLKKQNNQKKNATISIYFASNETSTSFTYHYFQALRFNLGLYPNSKEINSCLKDIDLLPALGFAMFYTSWYPHAQT